MERLYKPSRIRQEPLIGIVWVLALTAILGGLYLVSPFLSLTAPSSSLAVAHIVTSYVGIIGLAILAIISGLWMIIGIRKNRVDHIRHGIMLNIALRVYASLASLMIYGSIVSWVSVVTIIGIEIICYVAMRR